MRKIYTDIISTPFDSEASLPEIARTDNLHNVIERIQRRYGNDFEAFFRDAKKSTVKKNPVEVLTDNKSCL